MLLLLFFWHNFKNQTFLYLPIGDHLKTQIFCIFIFQLAFTFLSVLTFWLYFKCVSLLQLPLLLVFPDTISIFFCSWNKHCPAGVEKGYKWAWLKIHLLHWEYIYAFPYMWSNLEKNTFFLTLAALLQEIETISEKCRSRHTSVIIWERKLYLIQFIQKINKIALSEVLRSRPPIFFSSFQV